MSALGLCVLVECSLGVVGISSHSKAHSLSPNFTLAPLNTPQRKLLMDTVPRSHGILEFVCGQEEAKEGDAMGDCVLIVLVVNCRPSSVPLVINQSSDNKRCLTSQNCLTSIIRKTKKKPPSKSHEP